MRHRGIFRPNALVINPKKIFPIKPPMHNSDATHDASSIVIGPDGNGVSFVINKIVLADGHPQVTP